MIRPERLRPGDRVALVSPAGPVSDRKIDAAHARCRALGLEPVMTPAARARTGYLAGPDADRAADLQRALQADDIAAVWALRGGYGAMRLLPHLDLSCLHRRPKPFIGFSDNTSLHLALARAGLVSFHGPNAGDDDYGESAAEILRRVLFRAEPAGVLPAPAGAVAAPVAADGPQPAGATTGAPAAARSTGSPQPVTLFAGSAVGPLAGGNLALLAAACGTPYALGGAGAVVLVEDVGEPLYRIDRMLTQLRLAGCLDGAAGFAFGRFTDIGSGPDDPPLERVLAEAVMPLGVPAAAKLCFGHVAHNWTLPLGVPARLDAAAGTLEVLEPAVE